MIPLIATSPIFPLGMLLRVIGGILSTMENEQLFQELAVKVERPNHHFVFLIAPTGAMLGLDDSGDLALYDEADDHVTWDRVSEGLRHVATGNDVAVDVDDSTCVLSVNSVEMPFSICHGPEKLPSEYLEHLRREGWVCLTCILPPDTVDGLQRVASTDRYEHLEVNNEIPKICQDIAVGRAIAEPVSLWLIRQYVRTRDLHLGHPPGFAVLRPYDGESRVQGWHSDIPYIPSIGGNLVADRKGPIKAVQRNVCVSDFTKQNGATAFKLGSHAADAGPPPEWNPVAEDGSRARPYSGPDADVVEAPAGSIILYDARTWHRAGFNHGKHQRAAMLSSFQTVDVIPKRDTRPAHKRLRESSVYEELNAREQREITELLLNQPEITVTAATS